jgi:hypothetical protein
MFTATAGGFAGTHDMTPPAIPVAQLRGIAGILGSGPSTLADVVGRFFMNVSFPTFSNGPTTLRIGEGAWIFLDERTADLTAGATYPATFSFVGEGTASDAFNPTPGAPAYRYPGTGPGTCSITLDSYRKAAGADYTCVRARFTCTGLVGKDTGATFDLDGKISSGK